MNTTATITIRPEFGDVVRWSDAGTVITGRVTFVGEFTVRVVPTGESDQAWRWIDVADIVADEPIPGQLDLFAGEHPCASFAADLGGAHPWCSTCGWQQPNHSDGRDRTIRTGSWFTTPATSARWCVPPTRSTSSSGINRIAERRIGFTFWLGQRRYLSVGRYLR